MRGAADYALEPRTAQGRVGRARAFADALLQRVLRNRGFFARASRCYACWPWIERPEM